MPIAHILPLISVLAIVAAIAPTPRSTDRGFYEQLGRAVIIRDCSDIHCFRPLVAAVLEHLPGPSLPKWKAYAVIANAIGALAVGSFCSLLGLSGPTAIAATWLSALGTGSLYSLYDCYTADPLMYMLGPLLAIHLWQGRTGRAGWIAAVGVLGKEFAAAPLWIFTAFAALSRRWSLAARLLLVATAVMIVWLAKQAGLMAFENYRYGFTASVDLLHGGYINSWLDRVGWSGAAMYLFTTFGALYVLMPAGFLRAGRDLRLLAIATVPAALAFLYVEQPERALWNFHFIAIPLAAVALDGLPLWLLASFVAASSVVGLRFGAQLDIQLMSRIALVMAMTIAAAAVARSMKGRHRGPERPALHSTAALRRFWTIAALEVAALAVLGALMWDVNLHRRDEATTGINQWGFRGPLRNEPKPSVRVALIGGSEAFEAGTAWADTLSAELTDELNARLRRRTAWVDNLSEPGADASAYVATLRDYAYLQPDVVCILADAAAEIGPDGVRRRRDSLVFRTTGYLPAVLPASTHDPQPPTDSGENKLLEAARLALNDGRAVLVATSPSHEALLTRELGAEPRFRYVNLDQLSDRRARVERLTNEILSVLPQP